MSGHAIVGDPFAAKLVLADPRYRIGEAPSARKPDEHHAAAVLVPHKIRQRVLPQFFLNGHLDFHVPLVVGLEDFPFLRCVRGGVKMAIAILVNGRCAEVPDQGSSFAHLLLLQLQDGSNLRQGEG